MTFKKNLLVILSSIVFVLIGAWLVRLPRDIFVYLVAFIIAAVPTALMFEDFWRKMFNGKPDLTWQYFAGTAVVILAILAWLWTVKSVTMREFWLRLGVCVFSGGLAYFWFSGPYIGSIIEGEAGAKAEEMAIKKWAKIVKKLPKAKPETKAKMVSKNLRHRLTGDNLSGDLVLDKPIAFYEGGAYTLAEINKIEPKDESDPVIEIAEKAARYVNMLLTEV